MELEKLQSLSAHIAEKYFITFSNKLDKSNHFPLTGEGKFIKQTGADSYAHVKLLIEKETKQLETAREITSTYIFDVDEEKIPKEFRSTIIDSLRMFMLVYHINIGANSNLRFRIIDGSYHKVDSKPRDYEMATYRALLDAFKN